MAARGRAGYAWGADALTLARMAMANGGLMRAERVSRALAMGGATAARAVAAVVGLASVAVLGASAGGCGVLFGGGVTSAVPTARGIGGAARIMTWIQPGDFEADGPHDVQPFLGATMGTDVGPFGWRYFIEANAGVLCTVADLVRWQARAGVAPVALGHRKTDPDPDAWFGLAVSANTGFLFGTPSGFVFGIEAGVAQDIAYASPGSGTYVTGLLTFGLHVDQGVSTAAFGR